jgi:hypothetical protein
MQPILDVNRNRLDHYPSVDKHIVGQSPEHPHYLAVIASFMQDEGEISIAIGAMFSAGPRTIKDRTLQSHVIGESREERAYRGFGVRIQELHGIYSGHVMKGAQLAQLSGTRIFT